MLIEDKDILKELYKIYPELTEESINITIKIYKRAFLKNLQSGNNIILKSFKILKGVVGLKDTYMFKRDVSQQKNINRMKKKRRLWEAKE